MRRDKWLACPVAAVLSFLMSFAGVMCLCSAFGLQADVGHVALGCAISAVVFSLGFTVKFWYIPLLLLAPVAGYLWRQGSLSGSIQWLLYQVSATYDQAYGCGVLYWSAQPPAAGDATMALCAAGCIVAWVAAWTVCRRKPAIFAVFAAVLPLAACFVITDRVPDARYLYWLLLSVTVLLLSQLTRRQDAGRGNRLTMLVTVPAAIGLLILFWAVPQSTYRGQDRADRILQSVQSWLENAGKPSGIGTSGGLQQTVELDTMGRLVQTHTPVMTVHADQAEGTFYLRRQGFQMYDGTSWYNEYGNDIYDWVHWDGLYFDGYVSVTTRTQHLMKFVPYYAQDVTVNEFGITANPHGEYTYTFTIESLPEDAPSAEATPTEGGLRLPIGTYTPDAISLPASTVEWAEPMALSLVEGKTTVKDRAEAIGDYVRSLARYSRNTGRMPADETDFAKWFAFEADTGYCVHFATTAAVLLRAAGIQAQYVEGYVVTVEESVAATVYEDQAHAWVEYYDPAVGWRILECTPGATTAPQTGNQTAPQTQPTPDLPQPTEPEQTPEVHHPVWTVLCWIFGALGGALLLLGQWQLRVRLRKAALERGTANDRALRLWREVARLSRYLKQRPPQALYALAQKAKFSQHVLTVWELEQLTGALDSCRQKLSEKPWYLQPIYTILLAVY